MALRRELDRLPNSSPSRHALLRIAETELRTLEKHLFKRYPMREWGTFFRFGYRRTSWGLALSYVEPLLPGPDDLDRNVSLTRFRDQYSRRAFHAAAEGPLAVGVVHSHPRGCATLPSSLDDDMDLYFSRELTAFSKGAPYCSLILQRNDLDELTFTARVFDRGKWLGVDSMLSIGRWIRRWQSEARPRETVDDSIGPVFGAAHDRATAVLGEHSLARLTAACVGIVGCSGTGSPANQVLARAGVGEFVLVDPQRFDRSNLERIHGSTWNDAMASRPPHKVMLARDLILSINPKAKVTAMAGNVLHDNVVDELLRCDVLVGAVDTQHARAAFSDLAHHYLLPSIDMGILMDGERGRVSTQLVEFNRWSADLACAFCGGRIDGTQMSYELMTEEEQKTRRDLARLAAERGDNPDAYWQRPRQLHTVGYLASAAGAMAAGYVEGWLTEAFQMPHPSFQFDFAQHRLAVAAPPRQGSPDCSCGSHLGWGDQARPLRNVSLPPHWPRRGILLARDC